MSFVDVLRELPSRPPFYWPHSVKMGTSVVIFGAGGRGIEFAEIIRRSGVEVICFLDNASEKNGTEVAGIPVYTPENAPKSIFSFPVVVCSHARDVLYFQAKEFFEQVFLDFRAGVFKNPGEIEVFERNYHTYLDMLEDEASKACFKGLSAAALTDEDGYRIVSDFRPWSHPVVKLNPDETMIDIGSYQGAGVISFARSVNNDCHIYAMEPHPLFFTKLCKNLSASEASSCITPLCAGVGVSTGICHFDPMHNTGWARVDENGELAIYVYTIDDLVRKLSLKPSLIASGALGVEKFFLDTARETIQSLKPKLMIGTHACNLELALKLRELVPAYRFYYGHHNMRMGSALNSRGILYATVE